MNIDTWDTKLIELKEQLDVAESDLNAARDELRQHAVSLTNKNYRMEDLAEALDWSVSYIRVLRKKAGAPQRQRWATPPELIPKDVYDEIKILRDEVRNSEREVDRCREAYVQFIRDVIVPAPTMTDVAAVLGISRQRVAQLIT